MSGFRKWNVSAAVLSFMVAMAGGSIAAKAQVIAARPTNFYGGMTGVGFGIGRGAWKYQTNQTGENAFIDSDTVRAIARGCGLSEADLATVQVFAGSQNLEIYQIGKSDKAYRLLIPPLEIYTRGRCEGHTKEFLLRGITNQDPVSVIFDKDLLVLAKARPDLRVSMMKRVDSGTYTNHAGEVTSQSTTISVINGKAQTNIIEQIPTQDEVCRWTSFVLVDGEIAWRYVVQFNKDGSFKDVFDNTCDAKEYDPKYQVVIKEVDDEVKAEMKKKGTFGKFGAVHIFWITKKEKLKARGVEWRSPAELNPNTIID